MRGGLGPVGEGPPLGWGAGPLSPCPPPPLARATFHTFILSRVVNVEVPIPHDCQLHRQVVDLHPFVGILQPGQRGKGKAGSLTF